MRGEKCKFESKGEHMKRHCACNTLLAKGKGQMKKFPQPAEIYMHATRRQEDAKRQSELSKIAESVKKFLSKHAVGRRREAKAMLSQS